MGRKLQELVRGQMMNEVSIAWGLPWPRESARRLQTILRLAIKRRAWGVAISASTMLEAQYHWISGSKRKLRANRELIERLTPLFERERAARRDTRKRSPVQWPAKSGDQFSPPRSRQRDLLRRSLGKAVRVEPASARVRALNRIVSEALEAGWGWEAFLAAFFSAAATSLVAGHEKQVTKAVRVAETLKRKKEVQSVFGCGGNPISEEMRRWQETARRAIRARMKVKQ